MAKVAGAQNFDGRNWHEQHIAKRTRAALEEQDRPLRSVMPGIRWRNWPVICGAAPDIGISPRLLVRSSAEAILPSGSAVGRMLCGRRT